MRSFKKILCLDSDNFLEISNTESQNGEYELKEMFLPSNLDKQLE